MAASLNFTPYFLNVSSKTPVDFATTAPLPENLYDNGVLGVGATLTGVANGLLNVDGMNVSTGKAVLVKFENTEAYNGAYTITFEGDANNPYILTRRNDFDSSEEMLYGTIFIIVSGTTQSKLLFRFVTSETVVVGTTPITFDSYLTITTASSTSFNPFGTIFESENVQGALEETSAVFKGIKTLEGILLNASDDIDFTTTVSGNIGLNSARDVNINAGNGGGGGNIYLSPNDGGNIIRGGGDSFDMADGAFIGVSSISSNGAFNIYPAVSRTFDAFQTSGDGGSTGIFQSTDSSGITNYWSAYTNENHIELVDGGGWDILSGGIFGVYATGIFSVSSSCLLIGVDVGTQPFIQGGPSSNSGKLSLYSSDRNSGLLLFGIAGDGSDSALNLFTYNTTMAFNADGNARIAGAGIAGTAFKIDDWDTFDVDMTAEYTFKIGSNEWLSAFGDVATIQSPATGNSAIILNGLTGIDVNTSTLSVFSDNLLMGKNNSNRAFIQAGPGVSNGEIDIFNIDANSGLILAGSHATTDTYASIFNHNQYIEFYESGDCNLQGSNLPSTSLSVSGWDHITLTAGEDLLMNLTQLKITGLPTSPSGLTTGYVWNNNGVLTIV